MTFDFHDTIAVAPRWFLLETRALPTAVLELLTQAGEVSWDVANDGAVTEAYRAMRMEVAASGMERDALTGTQHALRAVGVHLPDETIAPAIDRVMAGALADAHPRAGIQDMVRMLANLGVPLAVISSAVYHPFLEWCLEAWELRDDFVAVISSASCGYYKSHPGIYHCALAALGRAPHEVIHVGDSYRYDVETAHALGMQTVWVNLKGEERTDNVADLTVPDLIGLAPRLLELT